jgi:hypothetical protein
MVSWQTAFKTALKILVTSIGWYVLGVIIILAGWASGGLVALMNPNVLSDPLAAMQVLAGGVIATIIGGAIIYLGMIATTLKYSVELIADEVRGRAAAPQQRAFAPPPAPTSAPVESRVLSWTEPCPKCGKEMPRESKFCDTCGARLRDL